MAPTKMGEVFSAYLTRHDLTPIKVEKATQSMFPDGIHPTEGWVYHVIRGQTKRPRPEMIWSMLLATGANTREVQEFFPQAARPKNPYWGEVLTHMVSNGMGSRAMLDYLNDYFIFDEVGFANLISAGPVSLMTALNVADALGLPRDKAYAFYADVLHERDDPISVGDTSPEDVGVDSSATAPGDIIYGADGRQYLVNELNEMVLVAPDSEAPGGMIYAVGERGEVRLMHEPTEEPPEHGEYAPMEDEAGTSWQLTPKEIDKLFPERPPEPGEVTFTGDLTPAAEEPLQHYIPTGDRPLLDSVQALEWLLIQVLLESITIMRRWEEVPVEHRDLVELLAAVSPVEMQPGILGQDANHVSEILDGLDVLLDKNRPVANEGVLLMKMLMIVTDDRGDRTGAKHSLVEALASALRVRRSIEEG